MIVSPCEIERLILRYRFIYNHFPSLQEEHIIGRTDVDILTGVGVKESQDFKEVLEKRLHAKREITFETPLFGSKTFLIYVEPVFTKAGETFGKNYLGMDGICVSSAQTTGEEKRKDGKA
ncbi:hypothetical protein ACE6H2_016192 [Prunus campanulata]